MANKEDREKIFELFKKLDKDNNGFLDLNEVKFK
jgi:Ca2+-binding EF-hand superfamily protein